MYIADCDWSVFDPTEESCKPFGTEICLNCITIFYAYIPVIDTIDTSIYSSIHIFYGLCGWCNRCLFCCCIDSCFSSDCSVLVLYFLQLFDVIFFDEGNREWEKEQCNWENEQIKNRFIFAWHTKNPFVRRQSVFYDCCRNQGLLLQSFVFRLKFFSGSATITFLGKTVGCFFCCCFFWLFFFEDHEKR